MRHDYCLRQENALISINNATDAMVNEIAQHLGDNQHNTKALLLQLAQIWDLSAVNNEFPCIENCTACCSNAAITCSGLEYAVIRAYYPDCVTNSGMGCLFKTKNQCSIYPVRPLVCRMFGYYFDYEVPSVIFRDLLMGEKFELSVGAPGYCFKKRRPSVVQYDDIANIMDLYKQIVDTTKIVILGTFKDKSLNQGLANIDRIWQQKYNKRLWIRE